MLARLCRSAARRGASLPAELALRGINLPPVAARLERRHAGALSRAVAGPLEQGEAEVVAALERDGVCITSLGALGLARRGTAMAGSEASRGAEASRDAGGEDVLACGQVLAAALAARVAGMGERRPTMIAATPDDMLRNPALYRFGLDAAVLRIVSAYLRLPVAYDGPLLFHTPADGREAGTRKWHLDREDRRVIKLALYLHDVDDAAGPFQILRHETRRAGQAFRYPVCDTAALGEQLGRAVGPQDVTTCTGPAGTLVFADTGRFYHRGKPATGRARSAVFYGYFARRPRHPFFCARSGLARAQIARLVEGLTAAQQACALWRDGLPLLARLVPPSVL